MTNTEPEPPEPRPFQFTIGSLMVVTVVGLYFGMVCWTIFSPESFSGYGQRIFWSSMFPLALFCLYLHWIPERRTIQIIIAVPVLSICLGMIMLLIWGSKVGDPEFQIPLHYLFFSSLAAIYAIVHGKKKTDSMLPFVGKRQPNSTTEHKGTKPFQFSIKSLMVVTAGIAVYLALGTQAASFYAIGYVYLVLLILTLSYPTQWKGLLAINLSVLNCHAFPQILTLLFFAISISTFRVYLFMALCIASTLGVIVFAVLLLIKGNAFEKISGGISLAISVLRMWYLIHSLYIFRKIMNIIEGA